MKKSNIILIVVAVAILVFLFASAKIIDKGTEGQYTGEVAFDASASSSGDWDHILSEITGNAVELSALDLSDLGAGKAVKLTGTVTEFTSKAGGKKNSMTIVPEGYAGEYTFEVQLGSVYTGTVLRDLQSLKVFGSFTNQNEWSQYAKAINEQMHNSVIAPLGLDESVKGKTVSLVGGATATGKAVTITPVSLTVQ